MLTAYAPIRGNDNHVRGSRHFSRKRLFAIGAGISAVALMCMTFMPPKHSSHMHVPRLNFASELSKPFMRSAAMPRDYHVTMDPPGAMLMARNMFTAPSTAEQPSLSQFLQQRSITSQRMAPAPAPVAALDNMATRSYKAAPDNMAMRPLKAPLLTLTSPEKDREILAASLARIGIPERSFAQSPVVETKSIVSPSSLSADRGLVAPAKLLANVQQQEHPIVNQGSPLHPAWEVPPFGRSSIRRSSFI